MCDSWTNRFPHRGHSLIELVTAMVAASMLLAGLASTMYIGRQIAYMPTTSQKVIDGAHAIDELTEELRYAVYIVQHSASKIEFVVEDRNGDAVEDTISYEWSGTAGDPLLKTLNHGTPRTVVDEIETFQITYEMEPATENVATWDESAESVLWTQATGSGSDEFRLVKIEWVAQHLTPLSESGGCPANMVDWSLTRIQFEAREGGPRNGQFAVQLRPAGSDGVPMSEILGAILFNESNLSSSWTSQTVTFSNPILGLSPHDDYAVVFQWLADAEAAKLRINLSGGSGLLGSDDSGASWDRHDVGEMSHAVYGTYRTPGTAISYTRNRLVRVGISLQTGDNAIGLVASSTRLVNCPELLSAYWRADFDRDPTAHDINGDGIPDWSIRGGGTFNTATLVDGIWQADATLDSLPLHAFDKITTVDVRMRNTSVGGNGALFQINADWSNGLHAPILVYLQLQSDEIQTLRLYGKTDESTRRLLCTIPDLPSRFLNIRLVLLPEKDRVQLVVDDVDYGSFVYPTFSPDGNERFASILSSGSDAEFDTLSIRVSE